MEILLVTKSLNQLVEDQGKVCILYSNQGFSRGSTEPRYVLSESYGAVQIFVCDFHTVRCGKNR